MITGQTTYQVRYPLIFITRRQIKAKHNATMRLAIHRGVLVLNSGARSTAPRFFCPVLSYPYTLLMDF